MSVWEDLVEMADVKDVEPDAACSNCGDTPEWVDTRDSIPADYLYFCSWYCWEQLETETNATRFLGRG